jgi:hypothetical protein
VQDNRPCVACVVLMTGVATAPVQWSRAARHAEPMGRKLACSCLVKAVFLERYEGARPGSGVAQESTYDARLMTLIDRRMQLCYQLLRF